MSMYFDTHAHYDDEAFDADRDAVLTSMPSRGVDIIMDAGSGLESSQLAMELAGRFSHVYAAVGWHPHEAKDFDREKSPELLRAWAQNPRVRAIGEIGLDFHYDFSPRDVQRDVFIAQLALADELDLPVVVHDREAHGECMELIAGFPGVRGEFHCFSGSPEMAEQLLKRGWYLGFNGAVTFKNARRALETIDMMPLDRLLLETDCPYLAPVPRRGERCDSSMLPLVAAKIGEVRGMTAEAVAEIARENGKRFFGIQ